MHKSYLEFSFHVDDLLFKGLSTHTAGGMVGVCICVALFTFIYESVKTVRQKLVSSAKGHKSVALEDRPSETAMLVEVKEVQHKWRRFRLHVVHALLYMLQVSMGYLLMLVIMSYNAWLALTVFAAAGCSYYYYSTCVLYRPSVVPVEILSPGEYE